MERGKEVREEQRDEKGGSDKARAGGNRCGR